MILVAGHYCHDRLIDAAGEHRALGGAAAYASAVLTALRAPHRVIGKAGPDFVYAGEVAQQPRLVPSARTTSFVDDYRGGERREQVEAVAPAIEPDDLDGAYDVGLACAVAGELPDRTLVKMRALCRVLIADAQALLREIAPGGEVRLRPLASVPPFDVLKASAKEARLLDLAALRARMTVIVTDGARGCTVLEARGETHVPAVPAREVDPTGAGDCFLAGYAWAVSRGLDPLRAARVGALLGAFAVEHVGVPKLTETDILAIFNA